MERFNHRVEKSNKKIKNEDIYLSLNELLLVLFNLRFDIVSRILYKFYHKGGVIFGIVVVVFLQTIIPSFEELKIHF